jgi:hypothetical protein
MNIPGNYSDTTNCVKNLLLRTRCVLTVRVGYDSTLIGEVVTHNMLGMLELEETC